MKNSPKVIQKFDFSWLKSPDVVAVFDALNSRGAKVFAVGGCVRNTVLGGLVEDIDLATDAVPEEVIESSRSANLNVILTGFDYGTITIVSGCRHFHVTTFRSDLSYNGRYPKVSFSKDIVKDASRRDFTINAIYVTRSGEFLDPLSGWSDLINGHITFIGNPLKRIQEDHLRILRYFRFVALHSGSSFECDESVLSMFSKELTGLNRVSKERIWYELKKILAASRPLLSITAMRKSKVLQYLLPGAEVSQFGQLLEKEKVLNLKPKFINRLISLNQDLVGTWIKDQPLMKKEKGEIATILKILKDESSLAIKGFKFGEVSTIDSILLSKKFSSGQVANSTLEEIRKGAEERFPLSASEDFSKYSNPSRLLGNEVSRLKKLWLKSNFELKRKELLAMIRDPNVL